MPVYRDNLPQAIAWEFRLSISTQKVQQILQTQKCIEFIRLKRSAFSEDHKKRVTRAMDKLKWKKSDWTLKVFIDEKIYFWMVWLALNTADKIWEQTLNCTLQSLGREICDGMGCNVS